MVRVILSHLFLFLLPFIGYAVWLWIKKKEQTSENWRKGPMPQLALIGLVMVIISLVLFANFQGAPEGTEFHPSRMEDGVFVPGGFK